MILEQSQRQKILILGGTNFMGKTLLDFLSKHKPSAQIYCINRGKIHWNNQARRHHNYEHFFADRKQHKDMYHMILYVNQKLNINERKKWKAVIDFSGFKWRDIQSIVKGINYLAERYIFISSDSVYNNMEQIKNIPIREDQFDISKQYLNQRKMDQINDKYGYNKLKCQNYILKRSKVPTYCLRLPDVIGPYDNTDRFWTTMQWIKVSGQYPIQLSAQDQNNKLSFIFSHDVCKFILQLIDIPNPQNDFINLAFRQNPTLQQFLRLIGKKLKIQPRFKAVKKQSKNCFPSTQCGPISIDKAIKQYNFDPTNLEQAIAQTIMFFNQKGHKYKDQRKQMTRMLNKKIKTNQQ